MGRATTRTAMPSAAPSPSADSPRTPPHARRHEIGQRRAQAAAERRAALRVVSALALLAVAAFAVHAGMGLVRPPSATDRAAQNVAMSTHSATSTAAQKPAKPSKPGSRKPAAKRPAPHRSASPASKKSTPARTVAASQPSRPTAAMRLVATAVPVTRKAAEKVAATPAKRASKGVITIETYGYSFGPAPPGCRFNADVRNIDAGTFSQSETGLMASVRKRVMATAAAQKWHTVFKTKWLPALKAGDKVSIGCSRGHHRSVSLAVVFAADLRAKGFTVRFVHRDIGKTW